MKSEELPKERTNGNKPAYPVTIDWDGVYKKFVTTVDKPGLTKREAFAMAAMQGLLANSAVYESNKSAPSHTIHYGIAKIAIEQADELLKQLEHGSK